MRISKLGTYTVEQYTSPNRGGSMSSHRGLVQHVAEGTYRGTISWQMNPDQRYSDGTKVNTCSTWIVGKSEGEIAQMVDTSEIAWCQRSGSRDWLSVEYAGYHTEALTPWQIKATALLLDWCNNIYKIPIQIATSPAGYGLGHHSMDRENLGEEWGHEDCPGSKIIAQKPLIISTAKGYQVMSEEITAVDKLFWIEVAYRASAILFDYDKTGPWTDPRDGKTVRDEPNNLKKRMLAEHAEVMAKLDAIMERQEQVLTEEQIQRIAAAVIAADNPLGEKDAPVIVSAVKQALREGTESDQ